jgi:hypothetical protein
MPDYSAQLTPVDRWAVVAYIKALQLSQNANAGDVGGQQIKPISDIAKAEGLLPEETEWTLPSTANVYGTPNGQDNGIPGQDKVIGSQQSSPAVLSKPGTPNPTPGAPVRTTAAQQGAAAPKQ